MAELSQLEEKLAEVMGLAQAAQNSTSKVVTLVEDEEISGMLERMREEAERTEEESVCGRRYRDVPMTPSDSEVVRALFERVGSGDVDFVLELISEDCVLEVPPSLSAEPDVYEGHEGARRYLGGFDGLVDDVRYEPLEILEEDGRVIAMMRVSGRGAASGIEVALDSAVVCGVEDGKITRMDPYPDLEAAREGRRGLE